MSISSEEPDRTKKPTGTGIGQDQNNIIWFGLRVGRFRSRNR